MPWGWILTALLVPATLVVLALALFHVRFRAAWSGEWDGFASGMQGGFSVEYGFPGFMRSVGSQVSGAGGEEEIGSRGAGGDREEPADSRKPAAGAATRHDVPPSPLDPPDARHPTPDSAKPLSDSRPPAPDSRRKRRDRNRWRRALFRLATDAPAWRLLSRHGFRAARAGLRLFRVRAALSVGHPDPVLLGRLAGGWHAAAPLVPGDVTLALRFQDRRPTFSFRAEGGFAALSLLGRGLALLVTFPWIGFARRARVAWKEHELKGWRRWVYRKLQR